MGFRHFTSGNLFGPGEFGGSQNLGRYYLGDNAHIVNDVYLIDLSIQYALTDRVTLTAVLPYMFGDRFLPVLNANKVVIERYQMSTRAFGDLSVGANVWVRDPAYAERFNAKFGLGVKIPTGVVNVMDNARVYNAANNTISTVVKATDQSMQPGDGGWGVDVNLTLMFFATQNLTIYAGGFYLFNPMNTNGVLTGKTGLARSNSIPDMFGLQAGVGYSVSKVKGLGVRLGLAFSGVPLRDALGSSEGFRRPGHELSIDPEVSYTFGKNLVSLGVPVPVYREKLKSLGDLEAGTASALAAFADYSINLNYVRAF